MATVMFGWEGSNIRLIQKLSFEQAEARMLFVLKSISNAEREDLFSSLKRHYCIHCGVKQPSDMGCQCWNDE